MTGAFNESTKGFVKKCLEACVGLCFLPTKPSRRGSKMLRARDSQAADLVSFSYLICGGGVAVGISLGVRDAFHHRL